MNNANRERGLFLSMSLGGGALFGSTIYLFVKELLTKDLYSPDKLAAFGFMIISMLTIGSLAQYYRHNRRSS